MFKLFGSRKHPKGPDWSKAKEHCLDFSGTKIYFSVPAHTDTISSFKKQEESYNIYDDLNYFQDTKTQDPALYMNGGFNTGWKFRGFPLFKDIGRLSLGISIIKNSSLGSLLCPNNFVSAINQNINYNVGPFSRASKNHYSHIRKNWFLEKVHEDIFVHYELHDSFSQDSVSYWLIPISHEHYIHLVFNKRIYRKNTNLNQAYDELIDKILSTVRIEWSADAAKQQIEAKAKWPDQKLPESLPELTWSDEEWRANETDDQRQRREFYEKVEAVNIKQGNFNA